MQLPKWHKTQHGNQLKFKELIDMQITQYLKITTQKPAELQIIEPKDWIDYIYPTSFERFASEIAARHYQDAVVIQTQSNADGGFDFLIPDENDEVYGLYGEAKRHAIAGVKEFARTIVAALLNKQCYKLIIVTSAKLNVSAYDEIYRVLSINKIKFKLLHCTSLSYLYYLGQYTEIYERYKLDALFKSKKIEIDKKEMPDTVVYYNYKIKANYGYEEKLKESNKPRQSSQPVILKDNERVIICFLIENISNQEQLFTITFHNKEHWQINLSDDSEELLHGMQNVFKVPKDSEKCFHCEARLMSFLPVTLPFITLTEVKPDASQKLPIYLEPPEHKIQLEFEPIFHKKCVEEQFNQVKTTIDNFINEKKTTCITVIGKAGTGKTRLVKEFLKEENKCKKLFINIQQKQNNKKTAYQLLDQIAKHCIKYNTNEEHKNFESNTSREWIEKSFEHKTFNKLIANGLPYPLIIHIDNLHLTNTTFLDFLSTLFEKLKNKETNICFIIQARNDDTYIDLGFKLFIDKLNQQQKTNTQFCQVETTLLLEEDVINVINSIFGVISENALQHILSLSENYFFHIFEVVKHLCGESIAAISSNKRYSIDDERQFYTKTDLPTNINKLFKDKLKTLDNFDATHKTKLRIFLTTFALCPCSDNLDLFNKIATKFKIFGHLQTLVQMNYLHEDNDTYRFVHNNVQDLLINEKVNSVTMLRSAAKHLIDLNILDEFKLPLEIKFRIYYHKNSSAYAILKNIIKELPNKKADGGITKFNDSPISLYTAQHFHAFEYAEKAFRKKLAKYTVKENDKEKRKQDALTFLSIVYFKLNCARFIQNYFVTSKMVEQSLAEIDLLFKITKLYEDSQLYNFNARLKISKLKQIAGHVEQNCSMIKQSSLYLLQVIMELNGLEMTTDKDKEKEKDLIKLKYEAYDRIRKNYLYMGDLQSAEYSLELAKKAVEADENNLLNQAIILLSAAEMNYVMDAKSAFNLWSNASEAITNCGDERVQLTYKLIILQKSILELPINTPSEFIESRLKELQLNCNKLKFVGPLPKIHLLEGLFFYKKGQYKQSIAAFEKAHNEAEKYAYGVFLWLSLNNMALTYRAMGNEPAALRAFKTAIDKAKKQGFLDYLSTGNILFFQNALISNCLAFCKKCQIPDFELELNKYKGVADYQGNVADDIFRVDGNGYLMTFI